MNKIKQRYRYSAVLLKQLVKTDFKLRYQSSFLGYLWSLLKPLFLFGILYVVFVKILKVDYGVPNSGIYLLLGIVLWSFFAELTSTSITSIVGKGDLLRKLNFPRYVLVLSVSLTAGINLFLNFMVVVIFMIISSVAVSKESLLAPIIFGELFIFALALGFYLSALFVRLRDINYVWEVIMQALFYATPILFPITLAPLWLQKVLMLSPLAQTIQDLRYLLVSKQTSTITDVYNNNPYIRLVPLAITMILFVTGALYFKSRSKYFAEEV